MASEIKRTPVLKDEKTASSFMASVRKSKSAATKSKVSKSIETAKKILLSHKAA